MSAIAIALAAIIGIFLFSFGAAHFARLAKKHGNGRITEAAIYGTTFAMSLWVVNALQQASAHGKVSEAWLIHSAFWVPIIAVAMSVVLYFTKRKKRDEDIARPEGPESEMPRR